MVTQPVRLQRRASCELLTDCDCGSGANGVREIATNHDLASNYLRTTNNAVLFAKCNLSRAFAPHIRSPDRMLNAHYPSAPTLVSEGLPYFSLR